MADVKMTAVVDAEDRASAVLSKVGTNAAGLGNKIKDLGPVFKGLAVAGTVAFGAISAIAVSALKESSEAAADMAIATGTLQNTFNDLTKNQVATLKKELGTTTVAFAQITGAMETAGKAALKLGFDDEEASKAYSKLFQVTKSTKEAQRELTIAQDFARAKNISLTDAVNKLVMVHSGATKALKAEGIQIDENATSMENIAKLEATFAGQALNYANTTKGAWDIMTQSTNNLKQAVGDALAPALTKLLEKVQPIIDRFTEWAAKNPDLLAKIILIAGAVAGLVAVFGTLGVILPSIIAFFTLLSAPVLLIIGIIGALVFAVIEVVKIFQLLQNDGALVWEGIKITITEKINIIKNAITTVLNSIKAVWEKVWGGIKTFFSDIWNSITDIAKTAIDKIKKFLQPIIDMIEKTISRLNSIGAGIKNTASKAGDFLIDKVGGGINKALGINDGIVQNGKIITTHPDDYIMAAKDPSTFGAGRNININISGAVMTTDAAKMLGDEIINQLRFQLKF